MTLPIIADVFRVALSWDNGAGVHAANVLHVRSTTANEDDIMASMNTHANSTLWYPISDQFSVRKVTILALDGTSAGKEYSPATPANWDGGLGGVWTPQVAALVKLKTGVRGPRGRGRLFLGPCAEAASQDGVWQSDTNRGDCESAWGVFAGDLGADDIALGVASYVHSDFHQVNDIVVPSVLATQKGRQDRLRAA